MSKQAIYKLIETVKVAVLEYDKSGDHRHVGTDGATTDCIRCNLVAAMFPQDFVKEARAIWGDHMEEGKKLHEAIETIVGLPAPAGLEIDELSAAVAGREATITIKPYRNGLHGVRVAGSAGVPRTGKHFARWNKS